MIPVRETSRLLPKRHRFRRADRHDLVLQIKPSLRLPVHSPGEGTGVRGRCQTEADDGTADGFLCYDRFFGSGRVSPEPGSSRPAATEERPGIDEAGPRGELPVLELAEVQASLAELVKKIGSPLSMRLAVAEAIGVEDSDVLVIAAKPGYNSLADSCGTDQAREKIAHCLQRLLRRPVTVRYHRPVGRRKVRLMSLSRTHDGPRSWRLTRWFKRLSNCSRHVLLHLEYDDESDEPERGPPLVSLQQRRPNVFSQLGNPGRIDEECRQAARVGRQGH